MNIFQYIVLFIALFVAASALPAAENVTKQKKEKVDRPKKPPHKLAPKLRVRRQFGYGGAGSSATAFSSANAGAFGGGYPYSPFGFGGGPAFGQASSTAFAGSSANGFGG